MGLLGFIGWPSSSSYNNKDQQFFLWLNYIHTLNRLNSYMMV